MTTGLMEYWAKPVESGHMEIVGEHGGVAEVD